MDDSQNVNPVRLDGVNDPKGTFLTLPLLFGD
jgi:hypothetical protein